MPKWLKRIEGGMERGGVDNPYALMNAMGIKRGSKTVVGAEEAQQKMSDYGRRVGRMRRRGRTAKDAGDALAAGR